MFDYVVIDTAPFLDEPVLLILERSDVVLLVVDMDLPAVKNAKLALDTLRLIKFPFEKIKLVLNRVNSKARLDINELERSLGLGVMAAVSSDKLVPRAVNEGEPVVSLYPRSQVARDLRAVANSRWATLRSWTKKVLKKMTRGADGFVGEATKPNENGEKSL